MNKILSAMLIAFMSITTFGISDALAQKTIMIDTVDQNKKAIKVEVPFNPQRIAVLNITSIDILDSLGLGDRIVGMIKDTGVDHLQKYVDNKDIVNLGGMKEVDMEALMSLQPDLILTSDRTVARYKEFIRIAPTIPSYVDYSVGFYQGFKNNVMMHAKLFDKEKEATAMIDAYDDRIEAIKAKADDKSAMLGIFIANSMKTLGDVGRASIITTDMGFNNFAADINVNHGNTSSYELIVKNNPDYLFILDKNSAVGNEGGSAKEMLNNELIRQTQAYKNGNIVFLEPTDVWYTADGGIKSMDIMIKNIEDSIK